jgi:hypothetical protein
MPRRTDGRHEMPAAGKGLTPMEHDPMARIVEQATKNVEPNQATKIMEQGFA